MILRCLKTWTILNIEYNYIFYRATLTAFREYINHNQERSHNIVLRALPDCLRRSLKQRNNELWILPTVNENSERPNGWFASSLVFVHTKDTGSPYIRLDYICKLCGQLVRGLEPRIIGRIDQLWDKQRRRRFFGSGPRTGKCKMAARENAFHTREVWWHSKRFDDEVT